MPGHASPAASATHAVGLGASRNGVDTQVIRAGHPSCHFNDDTVAARPRAAPTDAAKLPPPTRRGPTHDGHWTAAAGRALVDRVSACALAVVGPSFRFLGRAAGRCWSEWTWRPRLGLACRSLFSTSWFPLLDLAAWRRPPPACPNRGRPRVEADCATLHHHSTPWCPSFCWCLREPWRICAPTNCRGATWLRADPRR